MVFAGSPHQQDSCHSGALYEGSPSGEEGRELKEGFIRCHRRAGTAVRPGGLAPFVARPVRFAPNTEPICTLICFPAREGSKKAQNDGLNLELEMWEEGEGVLGQTVPLFGRTCCGLCRLTVARKGAFPLNSVGSPRLRWCCSTAPGYLFDVGCLKTPGYRVHFIKPLPISSICKKKTSRPFCVSHFVP